MTCFLLIRHGTTNHSGHILSGRQEEIPLNTQGREEAAALPQHLAAMAPDLLCCSPLLRCQQTAASLAAAFDLEPRSLPELQELDYGEWQGRPWRELEHNPLWQRYNQYRSRCRIPGGELLLEAQLRMLLTLEMLEREIPNGTVALVGHGDPIRAVIAYCLGMPLDLINRLLISTGSVSIITLNETEPRVHCVNNKLPLSRHDLFG